MEQELANTDAKNSKDFLKTVKEPVDNQKTLKEPVAAAPEMKLKDPAAMIEPEDTQQELIEEESIDSSKILEKEDGI